VREDRNPRGRKRGEIAELVVQGVREAMADGARCQEVETLLDEMEATRHALDIGQSGDLVVVCVDYANEVWKELQRRQHGASSADVSTDGPMEPLGPG
jgi:cyanophycin synthetase